MENDEIFLPTKDNHPDWEYMMLYINNIGEKVAGIMDNCHFDEI